MSNYNTEQDKADVERIASLGYHVIEITDAETQDGAKKHGMIYFKHIIDQSEVLFFRSFPDGNIGAGVGREIQWALADAKPVFELPVHFERRLLSVSETQYMLELCGGRKLS